MREVLSFTERSAAYAFDILSLKRAKDSFSLLTTKKISQLKTPVKFYSFWEDTKGYNNSISALKCYLLHQQVLKLNKYQESRRFQI